MSRSVTLTFYQAQQTKSDVTDWPQRFWKQFAGRFRVQGFGVSSGASESCRHQQPHVVCRVITPITRRLQTIVADLLLLYSNSSAPLRLPLKLPLLLLLPLALLLASPSTAEMPCLGTLSHKHTGTL